MAKVLELGGSCRASTGIGVTKLKYLGTERIAALSAYRRKSTPDGLIEPGKLEDLACSNRSSRFVQPARARGAHPPARTAPKSWPEDRHCVRWRRWQGRCCVFHPPRGLFYTRATKPGHRSLIERCLRRAARTVTSFELLRTREVADHCTICHKCLKPCPVEIDTGEVSVLERTILAARGYNTRRGNPGDAHVPRQPLPVFNRLFRRGRVRAGGAFQRLGARVLAPLHQRPATPILRPANAAFAAPRGPRP